MRFHNHNMSKKTGMFSHYFFLSLYKRIIASNHIISNHFFILIFSSPNNFSYCHLLCPHANAILNDSGLSTGTNKLQNNDKR